MKVINLFGGPCTGKSTVAAGLFFLMKTSNRKVELISEYAKQMVWEERTPIFKNQLYLLAKQNHRQDMLRGKVDYCITDSPLLLNLAYTPDTYYPSFKELVREVWHSYNNINFLLNRKFKYETVGRYQNETEANKVSEIINGILTKNKIEYNSLDADEETHRRIFKLI